MPVSTRRGAFDLAFIVLLFILLLAGALRVSNITSSPGWFRDEALYMEVAWNITAGEARIGPLNHTWVSPFQTQPPLYFLADGLWMRTIGALRGDMRPNIQVHRWFSAACGLSVILGVFALGLACRSALVGLIAAALLAFDPWAVMFSRMGLPQCLLAVEAVGAILLLQRHERAPSSKRLLLVVAVAATAPLTSYYGVALPLALAAALALSGQWRSIWMAALALVPLILFIVGLWVVQPMGLREDWAQFTADASGTCSWEDWAQDFIDLMAVSPLVPLGLLGLLMLPRSMSSLLTQLTTALYLFIWLRRPMNLIWVHSLETDVHMTLITYPLIPLWPLLALGTSQLLIIAWRHLRGDALRGEAPGSATRLWVTTGIGALILAVTLGVLGSSSFRAVNSLMPLSQLGPPDRWGFQSPLAQHLAIQRSEALGSPQTGPGVADWIWEQGVQPDDLIIAECALWWTLPGRHATLPQAVAYEGGESDFFRYPIAQERFAHPCDWRSARFIVLDDFTRDERTLHDPDLREVVWSIEAEWYEVFRAGRVSVYAPPRDRVERSADPFLNAPASLDDLPPLPTLIDAVASSEEI